MTWITLKIDFSQFDEGYSNWGYPTEWPMSFPFRVLPGTFVLQTRSFNSILATMKKRIIFCRSFGAIAIITALLLGQCTHYYYAPALPTGTDPDPVGRRRLHLCWRPSGKVFGGGNSWRLLLYTELVDYRWRHLYFRRWERWSKPPLWQGARLSGFYWCWRFWFYPTRFQGERGWHLMALTGVGLGGASNDYYSWNYLNDNDHLWSGNSNITYH